MCTYVTGSTKTTTKLGWQGQSSHSSISVGANTRWGLYCHRRVKSQAISADRWSHFAQTKINISFRSKWWSEEFGVHHELFPTVSERFALPLLQDHLQGNSRHPAKPLHEHCSFRRKPHCVFSIGSFSNISVSNSVIHIVVWIFQFCLNCAGMRN